MLCARYGCAMPKMHWSGYLQKYANRSVYAPNMDFTRDHGRVVTGLRKCRRISFSC